MYLPLSEYLLRTELAQGSITAFLARPGRTGTYELWEGDLRSRIDAVLRRRYAVPFGATPSTAEPDPALVPRPVKSWLATLLDEKFQRALRAPGDEPEAGDSDIASEAARVREAIADAADPDTKAHPELPLAATKPGESGVARGGPFVVSFKTLPEYWDKVGGYT